MRGQPFRFSIRQVAESVAARALPEACSTPHSARNGVAGLLVPMLSIALCATLLPPIPDSVGPRLENPRKNRSPPLGRAWTVTAGWVVRHRTVAAAGSLFVLAVPIAPVFAIHPVKPPRHRHRHHCTGRRSRRAGRADRHGYRRRSTSTHRDTAALGPLHDAAAIERHRDHRARATGQRPGQHRRRLARRRPVQHHGTTTGRGSGRPTSCSSPSPRRRHLDLFRLCQYVELRP